MGVADSVADGLDTAGWGSQATHDDHDEPVALLEVQRLDTEMEQLGHRRSSLPLREDLSAAIAERDACRQRIGAVSTRRSQIMARQNRLECEAASLAADADAKSDRLYSGEMRSIRDLEALQKEIEGLRARQGTLEEQAIEALIEADELADDIESMKTDRSPLDERVTVLETEVEAAVEAIDARLAAAAAARETAAAALEADVLDSYESLRPAFGHSTAVAFDVAGGCGCPNRMPTAEVARIGRCEPGAVLRCAECGRMVLR